MRKFVQVKCEIKPVKKREIVYVYPSYSASGKDFMKKGGDVYAVLDHDTGFWITDESAVIPYIDGVLKKYVEDHYTLYNNSYKDSEGRSVVIQYLDDSTTNKLKEYNVWVSNLPKNHNYIPLDTEITFSDDKVTPDMYRSKKLSYTPMEQETECYDKLMSTLYSEDDRQKIEWMVGSVLFQL